MPFQLAALGEGGIVLGCGLDDGFEGFELLARAFDGVVRSGQIVEMRDDVADAVGRVARLQHVVAHEIIEVANRFHGYGLVEKLQRLLRPDAQETAQRGRVLGELVEDLRTAASQPLA